MRRKSTQKKNLTDMEEELALSISNPWASQGKRAGLVCILAGLLSYISKSWVTVLARWFSRKMAQKHRHGSHNRQNSAC